MKKQTLKRVLVTSLAAAMTLSAFAGCNKTPSTTSSAAGTDSSTESKTESKAEGGNWTKEDNGVKLNEPGTWPIVAEGQDVTLKIFTAPHLDKCGDFTRGTNPVTDYMEKRIGVKFDWQMVTGADKQAKLNLLFTDEKDQLPDIIFGSYFNQALQNVYGEQELLVDMSQYMENEAYWLPKHIEMDKEGGTTQEQLDSIKTPDGKIYGLATYGGAVHSKFAMRMWMYEPWLKAVNKQMPTTTDELYDVLKAYKEGDPNGNGDTKDDIPMAGSMKGWNCNPTSFLMNSFQYYSNSQKKSYVDKDGKVQISYMQDGFKEGIKYMNKLNDEGLLLAETWTQDNNALKALTTQDVQKVGFAPGGSVAAFSTVANGQDGDWLNWKALPPLKGPNGVQYAETLLPWPGAQVKFNITTACKTPIVAFRFGDALYDLETAITVTTGIEGKQWRWAKDGEKGLDGNPAKYANITGGEATVDKNYCWSQITVCAVPDGWHTNQAVLVEDVTKNNESILYNAAVPYSKYAAPVEMILPLLYFEQDDAKRVTDLETDLNAAFDQAFTAMVTAKPADVDKLWDEFQANIKGLGIEDLQKLYQQAYDLTQKK